MSKYINTDRLRSEITKYESTAINIYNTSNEEADFWYGKVVACEDFLEIIGFLQQEQQGDLDKEIDNYFYPKNFKRVNDGVEFPGWHVSDWKNPNVGKTLYTEDIRRFAHHFYELKLNIRKEE